MDRWANNPLSSGTRVLRWLLRGGNEASDDEYKRRRSSSRSHRSSSGSRRRRSGDRSSPSTWRHKSPSKAAKDAEASAARKSQIKPTKKSMRSWSKKTPIKIRGSDRSGSYRKSIASDLKLQLNIPPEEVTPEEESEPPTEPDEGTRRGGHRSKKGRSWAKKTPLPGKVRGSDRSGSYRKSIASDLKVQLNIPGDEHRDPMEEESEVLTETDDERRRSSSRSQRSRRQSGDKGCTPKSPSRGGDEGGETDKKESEKAPKTPPPSGRKRSKDRGESYAKSIDPGPKQQRKAPPGEGKRPPIAEETEPPTETDDERARSQQPKNQLQWVKESQSKQGGPKGRRTSNPPPAAGAKSKPPPDAPKGGPKTRQDVSSPDEGEESEVRPSSASKSEGAGTETEAEGEELDPNSSYFARQWNTFWNRTELKPSGSEVNIPIEKMTLESDPPRKRRPVTIQDEDGEGGGGKGAGESTATTGERTEGEGVDEKGEKSATNVKGKSKGKPLPPPAKGKAPNKAQVAYLHKIQYDSPVSSVYSKDSEFSTRPSKALVVKSHYEVAPRVWYNEPPPLQLVVRHRNKKIFQQLQTSPSLESSRHESRRISVKLSSMYPGLTKTKVNEKRGSTKLTTIVGPTRRQGDASTSVMICPIYDNFNPDVKANLYPNNPPNPMDFLKSGSYRSTVEDVESGQALNAVDYYTPATSMLSTEEIEKRYMVTEETVPYPYGYDTEYAKGVDNNLLTSSFRERGNIPSSRSWPEKRPLKDKNDEGISDPIVHEYTMLKKSMVQQLESARNRVHDERQRKAVDRGRPGEEPAEEELAEVEESYKMKWRHFRQHYRDSAREFADCGSIQGLYVFLKNISCLAKLFWILMFMACLAGCCYMIYEIYCKWRDSPVLVSFATRDTPIFTIPFPAVTICPESKVSPNCLNYDKLVDAVTNNETLSPDDLKAFKYMDKFCKKQNYENIPPAPDEPNYGTDFYDFLLNCSNSMEQVLECQWMGDPVNCDDFFRPIITDEGLCKTFNMIHLRDIYRDDVWLYNFNHPYNKSSWSIEAGYGAEDLDDVYPRRALVAGALNSFDVRITIPKRYIVKQCVLFSLDGYRVSLHVPSIPAVVSQEFFSLPLDSLTSVSVIPELITTSSKVEGYAPEVRQCFFSDERPLRYFKTYTQHSCLIECQTNSTLKKCGCVEYYMPHTSDTPICGYGKWQCVYEVAGNFALEGIEEIKGETDHRNQLSSANIQCGCLPLCMGIDYSYDLSYGEYDSDKDPDPSDNFDEKTHMSLLKIYFKRDHFLSKERSELYGPTDFISNFGGILGLFTGFSILSIAEIIYFFTFRIYELERERKENLRKKMEQV